MMTASASVGRAGLFVLTLGALSACANTATTTSTVAASDPGIVKEAPASHATAVSAVSDALGQRLDGMVGGQRQAAAR